LAIFSFPHEIEILTESFFSKNKKFAKLVEIRHKKEFSHWVSSARQKSRYMQFVNAKHIHDITQQLITSVLFYSRDPFGPNSKAHTAKG
jgi:hypothetical protein